MNRERIEDEKKAKANNIRSQMRQKSVRKFGEDANQGNENVNTQVNELGDSTTSTSFYMKISAIVIQRNTSNINSS